MTVRRLLLTLLLLLALAALLWAGAGRSNAWPRAAALPPAQWLLALAGLLASYGLRSARLHAEWQGHAALDARTSLRITLLHIAALNLLPLRAGELGYPWLLQRHGRIRLADAVSSLVWMRLQDALVLSGLGSVAAVAVLCSQGRLAWPAGLGLLALAALALAAAATALGRWARSPVAPGSPAGARAWPWLGQLRLAAQLASLRARPQTWGWCLANWLVKLGTVAMLLAALAALPPLQAWCGALGGELGAAFPVQAPAGFGMYEAGSALAASLATGRAGTADPALWTDLLGAALVVHLFGICTAALAGAVAALLRTGDVPAPSLEGTP